MIERPTPSPRSLPSADGGPRARTRRRRTCGVTRSLVGGKDLRIEMRSRVTTNQVAPYAVLVLLLFGFAFDQNHRCSRRPRPGCSGWRCCSARLLAVQRSFAIESADGARDGLRLSGLDPAGIFLGKAAAIAAQLAASRSCSASASWSSSGATCAIPACWSRPRSRPPSGLARPAPSTG